MSGNNFELLRITRALKEQIRVLEGCYSCGINGVDTHLEARELIKGVCNNVNILKKVEYEPISNG